ncbi:thioesterase family protein [Luteococcus peritonei]|uniref:Acyl-CoA thioesterase n=2 Tax=Luteococcus peritonei TaxID=88874 RepID=A0ABW4RX02_9ACTN
MDAQAHVNNGTYVDYLQEARADFLLHGPNRHLLGGGVVVVGHSVDFLRPVVFSAEPLRVELQVTEVGASRFRLAYELFHEGEPVGRARTTLCPFDFTRQRPRRLTDAEREHFASLSAPVEPQRELSAPPLRGRGHVHSFRVRWSDLDSYGHVNNVRYFDYLQEARIAMTTALDPGMVRAGSQLDDGRQAGLDEQMWLVARQDIDYVVQMDHRLEPYQVVTAPVRLGTSSIVLAAEVTDPLHPHADGSGLVLARGRTVLVCADAQGRPQPLSQSTRAALSAALVTA